MSTSAWSNATGKMKPSYAELLRRAKEEKSTDGNGRGGSVDPGASSANLAVTTNAKALQAKQSGASEECKATSQPSPVQKVTYATPQANDMISSRSSDAHTGLDRNGQNRHLSSASSSSPIPAATGLKSTTANVWELRKLQKAEAAAALTPLQPASASSALGAQSQRASTQGEAATDKRNSLDKLPSATRTSTRGNGTTAGHPATQQAGADRGPYHSSTPSRNGQGRVESEEPRGAIPTSSVTPQSTDGAKTDMEAATSAASNSPLKDNHESNVSGVGATDNAWLANISMLNGGQNLPSTGGGAAVAADGLPAPVIASQSTTNVRNLPRSEDKSPPTPTAKAGSDLNQMGPRLEGPGTSKARQAYESPLRKSTAPEREREDSDRGSRAQKKEGRVGGEDKRKPAQSMAQDSDHLLGPMSAPKVHREKMLVEPAADNLSNGEMHLLRGAGTSPNRHTGRDGAQAAKEADQRLAGSRHAGKGVGRPYAGQELPTKVGRGSFENASTQLDTALMPPTRDRAASMLQPQNPRKASHGNSSYASLREGERQYGSSERAHHPEEWRGKTHPHTGRGRGGARGRGRGRGRVSGSEDRARQVSATVPMSNDGDWDSQIGNSTNEGAGSLLYAQQDSYPSQHNRTRAESAGRAYDAPLMYPAYGPSMHFDGHHHHPPPVPAFEARQPSWQQSGPYFYDAHPGQAEFTSDSSTYFPPSMSDNIPPGVQATVWTSPRPEHGALGARFTPEHVVFPSDSPVSSLVHQVEFYFSPQNLYKDSFLRQQMDPASGWVPLALIQSFKRVRMLSQELDLLLSSDPVLERLRHNPHVEMDEEGRRLRKRHGWQEWVVQPDGLMLVPPVMSAPMVSGAAGGFPPQDFGHFPHMRLDSEGGSEQQAVFVQPQQGFWLPHNAQMHSGYYIPPGPAQPMSSYGPPHLQHWQPAMGGLPTFPLHVPPTHLTTFDPRSVAYQHPSPPMSELAIPSNQASQPSFYSSSARGGSAQASSPDINLSQATSPSTAEQHSAHPQSPPQPQLQHHHGLDRQSDHGRHMPSQHHENGHTFPHSASNPPAPAYFPPPSAKEGVAAFSVDGTAGIRAREPINGELPRVPHDGTANAVHSTLVSDGHSSHLTPYRGAEGQQVFYGDLPAHPQNYPSSSTSLPAARSSVEASSSANDTPPLDSSMVSASSAASTTPSQRHQVTSSENSVHTNYDRSSRLELYGRSDGEGSQQEGPTLGNTASSGMTQSDFTGEAAAGAALPGAKSPTTLSKDMKHLAIGCDSSSALHATQTQKAAADATSSVAERHQRADEEDDDDEDVGLGVIAAEGLGGLVGRGA